MADSSYAALELLSAIKGKVSFVTRLLLDAALYDVAPLKQVGKRGRPRLKGERQPTLKARLADKATLWQQVKIAQWYNEKDKEVEVATGTAVEELGTADILAYFIGQWSDAAISRSTPTLLGLFSIVALWADKLQRQQKLWVAQTAWYQK